jgi:acyl dehydratase
MKLPVTRTAESVNVGDTLPPLSIPITVTGIVAAAIATRDYQNVHHDVEGARALGSPHIFMNILTTNGLVERFVTAWSGPEALLRSVKIRLGAPNYPGDTMVFSGRVVDKTAAGEVTVAIEGKNSLGNHVTGTVSLALAGAQATSGGEHR